jgi:DNA primase
MENNNESSKIYEDAHSEDKYIKYVIMFTFEIEGIVEKSDIIGAIFGQTEGIFGPSFDLREMAKTGKIGRIVPLNIETKNRKTTGMLKVTTTKEIEAAALIAALIESVDQVGPYKSRFRFKQIIDAREEKIKDIEQRAAEILEDWKIKKIPQAEEILETLRRKMQNKHVRMITVGREKLAAGPGVEHANEIILVEGRADVVTLVKFGINNVLSIGGGRIPEDIREIVKGKKVTAFLDGDRGGALNLRKLMQTVKIDFVAIAPKGKEVEELKPEEIYESLANKKPINAYLIEENEELKDYKDFIDKVIGQLEALLIKNNEVVKKIPVSELVMYLEKNKKSKLDTIILDGIITQRLIDIASANGVKTIVGLRRGVIVREPENIKILTFGE